MKWEAGLVSSVVSPDQAQPQWEEILHHSLITEPSEKSSGSLMLAQGSILILANDIRTLFLAPRVCGNGDTEGPPLQINQMPRSSSW